MNIKVMDCTLRDGGYRNNWEFTREQQINSITSLNSAKIEYIECGYLTTGPENKALSTKFTSLQSFNNLLADFTGKLNSELLLMIDIKDIQEVNLERKNPQNVYPDGIRLAFHKKDYLNINEIIKKISSNGYKLFLQPMVTSLYSDSELLQLITSVNNSGIEALYIVDSFGNLIPSELNRLFKICDKELNPSISLGFHPHNSLQLAYANTLQLLGYNSPRQIIIDSSVCGIGRGSGNLNTELIVNHLKRNYDKGYDLIPVLQIIDNVLQGIFPEKDFRETTSYFLAADRGCHPGYPAYFTKINSLSIAEIYTLINKIDDARLNAFNREYADKIMSKPLI
jgi:4-hydroxy 2-oxovalerate aldolase